MKNRGNKTILLIINVFLVTGIGIYRVGISIFGATSIACSIDPLFSSTMQTRITNVAQSYTSLKALAQAINKECPATHKISLERRADKCIHVTVSSENPYLNIGNQIVLLPSGILVPADCFIADAIAQLPVVALQKDQRIISNEFKEWLLHLDPNIIAQYAIMWVDDYEIYLQDKSDTHKSIVCTVNNVIDEKMRDVCHAIINEKNSTAHGTARNNFYSADIRFEKQIIICSQKGGAGNG